MEPYKPPANIPPQKLFGGICGKIDNLLNGKEISTVIDAPVVKGTITPMHCDKMEKLAKIMMADYTARKNMLITRLNVTLQSFIWAGRGKEKKNEVLALSNQLMNKLSKESSVSIASVLAARDRTNVNRTNFFSMEN